MTKVKLIDRVIAQIKAEIASGDLTALEGMLALVSEQVLRDYLPERTQDD